jgi:hypothetical protein
MKLIVAGSTGFVATEIIRQAISNPAITSIIALARRETIAPANAGADASKLKSVICDDFSNYPEDVKKELAGANACIWYGTIISRTRLSSYWLDLLTLLGLSRLAYRK